MDAIRKYRCGLLSVSCVCHCVFVKHEVGSTEALLQLADEGRFKHVQDILRHRAREATAVPSNNSTSVELNK